VAICSLFKWTRNCIWMNHKNEGMCLKAWVSARVVTKTMKNPMRLDLRLKKKK
jgi:hypothetical protein